MTKDNKAQINMDNNREANRDDDMDKDIDNDIGNGPMSINSTN